MLRTFGKTYRGEGILGFYKGIASPLIGSLPYNTSVFTISELVKQKLGNEMSTETKSFVAGATAGCLSVFMACPFEVTKVRA